MTFFNKKEDVLEVVLTPYGRKLLSHGKLKPEYYAFFDDDIVYDSGKAGFSETNSQSKTRILTETPSMRPQHTNFSPETTINTDQHPAIWVLDNFSPKPIGTNSQIEKKTSGWNIISLDKECTSFSLTSSLKTVKVESGGTKYAQGQPILQIPQINFTLEFTMSVGNLNSFSGLFSDLANEFDLKEEGDNFIKLEKEQGVLYFMEKNGFVNKDAFEAEVYIYEEDENNYKKLNFAKMNNLIENDLLQTPNDETMPIGPDSVEFYLDLLYLEGGLK